MPNKQYPQIDSEGFFSGASTADADPMNPGHFLIPAGALDVSMPIREAKQFEAIQWTGKIWLYVPDYTNSTLYSIETGLEIQKTKYVDGVPEHLVKRGQSLAELKATLDRPDYGQVWDDQNKCWAYTFEQIKTFKLNALADLRWQVQCAGVKVAGINHQNNEPVVFASSPDDLTRLTAAIEYAQEAYDVLGEETTVFKAKSGFIDVTVDQLNQVRQMIMVHTSQCYKAERSHADIINVLTAAEDMQKYNLNSGWPI